MEQETSEPVETGVYVLHISRTDQMAHGTAQNIIGLRKARSLFYAAIVWLCLKIHRKEVL